MTRILCSMFGRSNDRPLKLHFQVNGAGDAYLVDRPFRCGGLMCCPKEMFLFGGGTMCGIALCLFVSIRSCC